MLRASGRTVVGLDIEPGYIAAVESKPGSVAVERAAVAPLPDDVLHDGEVVDPLGLSTALRELFAEHKLGKRVRIGVANQRVVMRTIDLPPLTDAKQLASAVRFQAQEQIPMPLDQAVFEHQSLGIIGTADGPKARVALVAARRDMVDSLVAAVRAAGLRPAGVDLSAFALIRAVHQPTDGEEPVVYLNVGAITNLALATGTQCLFTRVVASGTEQMVTDLAEWRGLTREHAAGWLRHVGLVTAEAEIEGEAEIVSATRAVLTGSASRIAEEIRTTLNFYAAQDSGIAAQRAVISGPVLSIPGFAETLGEALQLPTEARTVLESQTGAFAGIEPGQLTVAAGLTTAEAPR
jgi:type IV pilus assembly protein PilM